MIDDRLTLEILRNLMNCNTVNPPGNEKNAAQYLEKLFIEKELPCTVQDLGNNRANFIAEFGEGDKCLELCGHLDVVPCTGEWKHQPIGYTEQENYIYGRGACDMKGGVAAMCSAVISVIKDHLPFHGRLRLAFVADEEDANLGMHSFLSSYPAADYSILGEPTELHVAVAHRGVGRYFIDCFGRAHHAALRSSVETSIHSAARAVFAIDALNERLRSKTHEILPPPSIAVTMVKGYEKDNIVPGDVQLLVDFRILPGMTEEETREMLIDELVQAGIQNYSIHKHFFMPGGETNAWHPFVRECLSDASGFNRREETPCAFDASCEQCFLVEAGSATVILGPGSLAQAHTVDEYVVKEQVLRASYIYRKIIENVLL